LERKWRDNDELHVVIGARQTTMQAIAA